MHYAPTTLYYWELFMTATVPYTIMLVMNSVLLSCQSVYEQVLKHTTNVGHEENTLVPIPWWSGWDLPHS